MSDEKTRKLADCYRWRGQSYHQAGNDDLAIQDQEKAVELYCAAADDYMNLGFAYRQKADNTEDSEEEKKWYLRATEYFTKAIEMLEK